MNSQNYILYTRFSKCNLFVCELFIENYFVSFKVVVSWCLSLHRFCLPSSMNRMRHNAQSFPNMKFMILIVFGVSCFTKSFVTSMFSFFFFLCVEFCGNVEISTKVKFTGFIHCDFHGFVLLLFFCIRISAADCWFVKRYPSPSVCRKCNIGMHNITSRLSFYNNLFRAYLCCCVFFSSMRKVFSCHCCRRHRGCGSRLQTAVQCELAFF